MMAKQTWILALAAMLIFITACSIIFVTNNNNNITNVTNTTVNTTTNTTINTTLNTTLNITDNSTGTLSGHITIGPLCPVEKIPPDPNCQPTAETYKAWPIQVSGYGTVFVLSPDADGNYSIDLNPGEYVVDLKNKNTFGAYNLPSNITILSGQKTIFDISIDTGIR